MSSWRDFALRGCFRAMRPDGTGSPDKICGADAGSARTKGWRL